MTNLNSIGKKIKLLRKQKGFTQQQLSAGICTQALVSMFESDETIPSSVVLYKMAKRLEVDINYFFETFTPSAQFYSKGNNVFSVIRQLVHHFEYHSANIIVEHELTKVKNLTNYEKAFYYWHKGIFEWELQQNKESALNYFDEAIGLATDEEELIVSILNSKAIIYYRNKDYENALETHLQCLPFFENNKGEHNLLFRKVLFGLSRTYVYNENLDKAYETCEKGIKITTKDESTYLLGELLFQKGKILKRKELVNEALLAFNQAKVLFQLNQKANYEELCNKNIDAILTVIR